MNKRLFSLTLGLLASAAVAGEEPAAPVTAGYHLKSKSSFASSQTARSPFWPIGWTPSSHGPAKADGPAPDFTLKPDAFAVTSILLGARSFANINGGSYAEGEYLQKPRAPKPADGAAATAPVVPSANALPAGVKVRVVRIMDGQVILQAGTQSVVVPLRRQQLLERKPGSEEELLLGANADR